MKKVFKAENGDKVVLTNKFLTHNSARFSSLNLRIPVIKLHLKKRNIVAAEWVNPSVGSVSYQVHIRPTLLSIGCCVFLPKIWNKLVAAVDSLKK